MFGRYLFIASLAALLLAGCSEPADVAGDYSMAITNGQNGCNFDNWTMGDSSTDIGVTITQNEDIASAEVRGLVGGFLSLWLGSNLFRGEVSGSSLALTLFGTTSRTQGSCSYTINSELDATLDGDLLHGRLYYHSSTNGSPDCGVLEGCVSVQDFNGTRPPR